MRRMIVTALCSGTMLGGLVGWTPAMAQATAPQQADEANPADIIVTARRVEERLQDVPISITVFNQAQIDNRNVTSGSDLATYTPSLSANTRFGTDNASFAIRGFTQEARTTASVGVYFADVVAPRGGGASIATGDGAGPGSFFDLQNVQVLKGPQGTLFGRNTTGGAVLLVPRKPTSRLEGYAEGSIGNYDMRRFQAVANIPVAEAVRLRLGVDRQTRDGYYRNISGIGPKDFGDADYIAARGSLVLDLSPDLENYTVVSYSRSDTNGQLPQLEICNPANYPGGVLSCQQIARRTAADAGRFAVQSSIPNPVSLLRTWQVINTLTWRVSDALTIKNIGSYSQLYNNFRADFFGTDWVVPATITNPTTGATVSGGALTGQHTAFNSSFVPPGSSIANQENLTEELQFQGSAFDGRLSWQAGGYVELSDPLHDNGNYAATRLICSNRFALQCTNFLPGVTGSLTIQKFRVSYHDYGTYGQATYSFTDRLKLTGGLRYTWDVSRSRSLNAQYTFPATGAPIGLCANPLVRARNRPITTPEQCLVDHVQKSDAPTWVVDLDYTPIDNVLVYAKYARGYRQGSVNPVAAGGFNSYEPERVDAYELGAKTSWRGALPGYFNLSGFYNDLQNQQLALGLTSSPAAGSAPPNNAIVNIGKSRIKGFEIEAGVGPFHGFRVEASYAYIDSELLSTAAPVFPAGSPYDGFIPLTAGLPAPFTPKNKYSITGTYTLPLPDSVGAVSVGATYSYTGSQLVQSSIYGTLPSYKLLNLNLNWSKIAGTPVDLGLFATNVTNRKYAVSVNDMYASSGFVSSFYGQPRMYGLRLRYSFAG
jgi:iron complex outermembrane receptor protein